jgi:hypothetical protein
VTATDGTFQYTVVAQGHNRNVEGTTMNRRSKVRMGRPPRTDNPVRVGFILPGAVRKWLQAQSRTEGRAQSDVMVSALEMYRRRNARRTP